MTLSSVIRTLDRSNLIRELTQKLQTEKTITLSGFPRLPKGIVISSLAQSQGQVVLVICPTLEEAGKWTAQLEMMAWKTVYFYPTSEASPYDPFDSESEMIWGQLQVLSHLLQPTVSSSLAIVTTERALQPHLPPKEVLSESYLILEKGMTISLTTLETTLAGLGFDRTSLVESEGQWSRRGDIIDIFPVSAEIPVRLEFFGDDLEKIREFDPNTQRSLDIVDRIVLTPTSFSSIILNTLQNSSLISHLTPEEKEQIEVGKIPEGLRKYLGLAYQQPSSILDYLPPNTYCVVDEIELCQAHAERWIEHIDDQHQLYHQNLPKYHQSFAKNQENLQQFPVIYLSELAQATDTHSLNISSRPLPVTPHQFAKLAEIIRGKREIYTQINLYNYQVWLISAQPSRTVSLLQEHDCPSQFIPNPKDYPAIERLLIQKTAVALKYAGQAELEGFILPTFRIAIVTDKEFFGQHNLASPTYIRKRRKATSQQVDLNKLNIGDYIVHKSHGIGQFLKLEALEGREYIVLKYADGLIRIPADNFDSLSRYRHTDINPPELHKMSSKIWERTKNRARKTIKKLAVDLLKLYAKRSEISGFAFPPDSPWQFEMEDSFPYNPTADQLKAVQDIKRDLESDRPMDRLVCGDVGFGKTEVAIRAIFKVVTSGHKQVVLLAPTTILTQQHYHTLKERFAPYPINIGLLNRFRSVNERKDIIKRLKTGELDIVVGTHQVLSKEINFHDLGLLVIDEEQRFGVNQKEKIKALKSHVDVLTLSATPIPRTLYMSLSGVREMSLITTPPPSRRPIQTHISPYNTELVSSAIRNELERGGQVFYVVPRVEGIEEKAGLLREMIPSARIAIGHGQMVETELESVMLTFSNGEADILVCTTIIESGLDIPRVNTIIVEDAQKFGLSQLYQLRGRVGRSGIQAHAWLLYPGKQLLTETARQRLRALQEFTQLGSGYQLATRDMEIRGVGNILGAEQSGHIEAIGFELYMEMLQEALQEIQGQRIPQVEETKIDLQIVAFIPANYIPDADQKTSAYRLVASATSKKELKQITEEWIDRYGKLPEPAQQLLKAVELKFLAKSLGFSRIKPEGKQNIILETPMEEPMWKLLSEQLPDTIKSKMIYMPGKVLVKGLGLMKPSLQMENLINWFHLMEFALNDPALL